MANGKPLTSVIKSLRAPFRAKFGYLISPSDEPGPNLGYLFLFVYGLFQPSQPLLRILYLSYPQVGVFPEVEEFLVMLYGFALPAFLFVDFAYASCLHQAFRRFGNERWFCRSWISFRFIYFSFFMIA